MPSVVDLCNTALSHIGAENTVTSIDPPDGSVEAGHCATFWPIARRFALEMVKPTWAKKRVTLAQVTNTSTVWEFAYALPSDCVHPLRVLNHVFFLQRQVPVSRRLTEFNGKKFGNFTHKNSCSAFYS